MAIDSRQQASTSPDETRAGHAIRLIIFLVALLAVAWAVSWVMGVDPANRDLVDTDGYMRYLRIEKLIDSGDWFDSTFTRSNYPFGESQHWTRPLDTYVVALTGLIDALGSTEALYWASYVNAPILLMGLALCMWIAVRLFQPRLASLLFPVLLTLPMVINYGTFGRVDHHALVIFLFGLTVLSMLKAAARSDPKWSTVLGASLAVGLWVSTEYLFPIALVAATLAWCVLVDDESSAGRVGTRVFGVAAVVGFMALVSERGVDFGIVEYDKISLAHVVALTVATGTFAVVTLARKRGGKARPWFLVAIVVGGIGLLLAFPDFIFGPFVDVDPRVRDLWLNHVGELRPVWAERPWMSRALVLSPTVLGLLSLAWLARRKGMSRHDWILAGWLIAYAALSAFQVRWAVFAHLLATFFILRGLSALYERFESRKMVALRPLLVAVILFGPYAGAIGLDSTSASGSGPSDCVLDAILPVVSALSPTVVAAGQDLGPEILYRTHHDVIATPYHRNEAGMLYVHELMSLPVTDWVPIGQRLAERDVGLIVVCPSQPGILQPKPDARPGSFYDSLVTGEYFGQISELETGASTGFRVFSVNS